MEPNKILSASILDLVFDNRNKDYGAYELRVTYPERIKRSMIVVFVIAGLGLTGMALANKLKQQEAERPIKDSVTLIEIKEEKPVPLTPPEAKKPEVQPVRTEKLTTFKIVDQPDVEPPPTQTDLIDAQVGTKQQDGGDRGLEAPVEDLNKGTGIIEPPKETEPDIYPIVQIPAKYDGDWSKFLTRNLNAEVPVDNGAPAGSYTIIVQFVVDKEGELSDIKALTSYGYGMEQEAIRVLKKAKGWKAGIQNGHEVKSYHKQPITFIVQES